jgi:hypothetical protein
VLVCGRGIAQLENSIVAGINNIDSLVFIAFLPNVKEHAPLSARASVFHGVDVETTEKHVNRAADRGCCVSSCSHFPILVRILRAVVAL